MFKTLLPHTPGPWAAEYVGVSSAGPDGVDVYEVCSLRTRVAEHLSESDARLITAAPDMLAALRAILDPATNEDSVWYTEARQQARAAVAKATGTSP